MNYESAAPPTDQTELVLQVLDFIERTDKYYLQTFQPASRPTITTVQLAPFAAELYKTEFENSRDAINDALAAIGGLKAVITAPPGAYPAKLSARLLRWQGRDPKNVANHQWEICLLHEPFKTGLISISPDVLREIRAETLGHLKA